MSRVDHRRVDGIRRAKQSRCSGRSRRLRTPRCLDEPRPRRVSQSSYTGSRRSTTTPDDGPRRRRRTIDDNNKHNKATEWRAPWEPRNSGRFGHPSAGLRFNAVAQGLKPRGQSPRGARVGNPDDSESYLATIAEAAYQANPPSIPFESARYRRYADANGDGRIAGREELYPLYLSAARDFSQPLFVYGPPRQIRFGMEFTF